jgi:hypothetical protein
MMTLLFAAETSTEEVVSTNDGSNAEHANAAVTGPTLMTAAPTRVLRCKPPRALRRCPSRTSRGETSSSPTQSAPNVSTLCVTDPSLLGKYPKYASFVYGFCEALSINKCVKIDLTTFFKPEPQIAPTRGESAFARSIYEFYLHVSFQIPTYSS